MVALDLQQKRTLTWAGLAVVLAMLVSKDTPWLTTEEFLAALDENLQKKMASA